MLAFFIVIMARFRGTVQGNRGEASRLGHVTTGLSVTARGWSTGVDVECKVENNKDVFYVYKVNPSQGTRNLINRIEDESER